MGLIFKCYVKNNGKKPLQKIKGSVELHDLESVKTGNCDYGGVLKEDIVMIDVDDPEEAKKVKKLIIDEGINCWILTTTRGYHFYFKTVDELKKNKIGCRVALGIKCDIKLGSKNTVVPLRIGGATRDLIKNDEIDVLPKWLLPCAGKDIANSNTRNNDLYTYILPLQGMGFSVDEIKETIKLINKYILDAPLDTGELDVILRDEAFSKPTFFVKGKFLHEVFAEYLIKNDRVIKIDNVLYSYQVDRYDSDYIERSMIKYIPNLTRTMRKEVLYYLELIAKEEEQSSSNYINCKNGILDIKTMKLLPHDAGYVIPNLIPYSYFAGSYDKTCDLVLDKISCGDKKVRMLLGEMVGYCLFRRNELGKFFILTGDGANGKSTFLNMIKKLLGRVNVRGLSLHEVGEKFKTAQLVGRLANIGDDLSNKYIDENDIFKKLVTGETVNVERKGLDPFDFTAYCKFLFACNSLPRVSDTSDGFMRRMEIIPFNAKFSAGDSDYDPYIADKLMSDSSIEYLFRLGIEGLVRVINNNGFTQVESSQIAKNEYEMINNPILQFIEEIKIENESCQLVYNLYCSWCFENGLKAVSKNVLGRELKKRGLVTKLVRVGDQVFKIYQRFVTD